MSEPYAGIILAGGLSQRMGQDKAQLQLEGETLLQRGVELLQQLGCQQVLVSRNGGFPGTLPDIFPQRGPLSGIHATLKQASLPAIVIAVDMPQLTVEVLQPLVENGFAKGRASYYEKQYLPLFIAQPEPALLYLEEILAQPDSNTSIKGFLQHLNAESLSLAEPHLLSNINTPQQWQLFLRK